MCSLVVPGWQVGFMYGGVGTQVRIGAETNRDRCDYILWHEDLFSTGSLCNESKHVAHWHGNNRAGRMSWGRTVSQCLGNLKRIENLCFSIKQCWTFGVGCHVVATRWQQTFFLRCFELWTPRYTLLLNLLILAAWVFCCDKGTWCLMGIKDATLQTFFLYFCSSINCTSFVLLCLYL